MHEATPQGVASSPATDLAYLHTHSPANERRMTRLESWADAARPRAETRARTDPVKATRRDKNLVTPGNLHRA